MDTKDVMGTINADTHKQLVRMCGMEGQSIRNKVGSIIEAYVESNRKEVLENGGKGTPGVHGQDERKPEKGGGAAGKPAETPSEKIDWLPA